MAFNTSFVNNSGIENFYNNSFDVGSFTNEAAKQDAIERVNAYKRQSSTFNNVFSADAQSKIDEIRMEGQQNLHNAQMFSKNLGTAAGFLSSGVSAFGKMGGFGGDKSLDGYSYGAYGNLPGEYDGDGVAMDTVNGGFSINPGQPSYYGLN